MLRAASFARRVSSLYWSDSSYRRRLSVYRKCLALFASEENRHTLPASIMFDHDSETAQAALWLLAPQAYGTAPERRRGSARHRHIQSGWRTSEIVS